MKMTGAEIAIKCLEKQGVTVMFGYPGGQIMPFYDKLLDSKKINHILVRHEQAAAHAADAYSRATGKVGVCVATSGPGATNLVTGIANAYMDSIPIVAITGQVPTPVIGTDAFQEADITGITLPIVKHSFLVKDIKDLPEAISESFYIAGSGRPGPVLIDLPRDVQIAEMEYRCPEHVTLSGYKPTTRGHAKQIKQAVRAIMAAERPVIYAGGGVVLSDSALELSKLVGLTKIPVTTTLMGKGAYNESEQLSLGILGMHGTRYANYAITNSDLLIAVGARFDDRVTGKLSEFASLAKVIHIDIDPAEISKNVAVNIPIVGDVHMVLKQLNDYLEQTLKEEKMPAKKEWATQIAKWKKDYPLTYKKNDKIIKPQYVIEQIYELTKNKKTIITTGVGQNQMFAALHYKAQKPRTFLSSGGLGTMGFGLPAAIGAALGKPDHKVIDIDGDGSFQMVSQEMATIVANKLPIVVVILNNRFLGMVRQWQELMFERRYSHTDLEVGTPDFVKLAEAYGAVGIRVTKPTEVKPALKKAIEMSKAVVLDIHVEREENVYPFVPPGQALTDALGGDE